MRHISYAILLAAAGACSNEAPVTQPPETPSLLAANGQYQITKISASLGGTSVGTSINNRGWVAGFSNLSDGTRHAALWRDGAITDLLTLGGPNSSVQWPGQNNGKLIVGIAELAEADSLNEDWSCSAFFPSVTHNVCRGFVSEDGVMTALPTLGGTHGFATGVNTRGQVVGWAETPVHDPTCNEPQVLQFRAVMWEPKKGEMQELPPLPGDSTSAATAINDSGLAVGISGECDIAVGQLSAQHSVIWENGEPTEIDNLGGEAWHTPMAINERGDVVGFSNPADVPGIAFLPHAFLWTKQGGIEDLGLIPGHDFSQAFAINTRGQIVGRSVGPTGGRAILWQEGDMIDLNDIDGGSPDVLVAARDINEAGVITGNLVEAGTGKTLVFVATPVAGTP